MDKDQLLLLDSETRQALDLLLPFGLGMQVLQEGQFLEPCPLTITPLTRSPIFTLTCVQVPSFSIQSLQVTKLMCS